MNSLIQAFRDYQKWKDKKEGYPQVIYTEGIGYWISVHYSYMQIKQMGGEIIFNEL